MASGRIQSLLISTRGRHVVYERFYDVFSESEKSEIRVAYDDTAEEGALVENQELVGRYRNGRIVAIPSGELIFFGLGTGEYNELAVSEVLRSLISVLKELFRVPSLSDAVLFQNFAQVILIIDEVCKEEQLAYIRHLAHGTPRKHPILVVQGLVEHLDKSSIIKTLAFKIPTFGADEKGKIMSRFSTKDIKQ